MTEPATPPFAVRLTVDGRSVILTAADGRTIHLTAEEAMILGGHLLAAALNATGVQIVAETMFAAFERLSAATGVPLDRFMPPSGTGPANSIIQ